MARTVLAARVDSLLSVAMLVGELLDFLLYRILHKVTLLVV